MSDLTRARIKTDEEIYEIEESVRHKHKSISNIPTPFHQVKKKGGFDYVEEGYMRNVLNNSFPIWNWDVVKYEILGDKWIVVQGKLTIVDDGITRHYDALASHRIQKNRETGDYVDIGNDIKGANSDCFKVACNRLCNIADDVYRKKIEDLSLNEEQKKQIDELLVGIDQGLAMRVKKGIETQSINRGNFSQKITKLKNQIK